MKRKKFLQILALSTLSLPALIRFFGGNPRAQKKSHNTNSTLAPSSRDSFRWTMTTTWPPGFPVLGESCELFADWVRQMSGGRLDIRVYGGGELVPPLEAFDAVRSGAADMGSAAPYYWAGKLPAAQFIASIPFGMTAQEVNAWLLSGGGWELWQELYADFNLYPLPAGNTAVQMGGWFNKKIETIADLQNLKMRIPGLGGKVLERVGGAPVLLAGSEIYMGLERGVIDATEWIGPYHDYLMGFHEIAKYYYHPGWHEPGSVLEMFINRDRFLELPEDLQTIVQTAALRVNHWVLSEFEAKNAEYLQKIRTETQVQILPFPQQVLDKLRQASREVIREIANQDPAAKRVLDHYTAFAKTIKPWSELGVFG